MSDLEPVQGSGCLPSPWVCTGIKAGGAQLWGAGGALGLLRPFLPFALVLVSLFNTVRS